MLNIKQMAPWIIPREMGDIYWRTDLDLVLKVIFLFFFLSTKVYFIKRFIRSNNVQLHYVYIYICVCVCVCVGVPFPARANTKKKLVNIGDLMTTSFSAGLSKDSGSIYSIHDKKLKTTQQHSLHVGSLISSQMTYSVTGCMSEKKVSSYKLYMTPSMIC